LTNNSNLTGQNTDGLLAQEVKMILLKKLFII